MRYEWSVLEGGSSVTTMTSYYTRIMRRKRYPYWLKVLGGFYSLFFPSYAERAFVRDMGQWWLRLHGYRAQHIVGLYRPDFVSVRRRRIIEIDGKSKVPKDIVRRQNYYDAQEVRDNYFFKRGYNVLHIDASEVIFDAESVRQLVREWDKNPKKYAKAHGLE